MPKGVRLNPQHDERTRAKIQTSQIINRLSKFVGSAPGSENWRNVEMTSGQVTAALGLLKKTLPDLTNIDMTANVDGGLTINIQRFTDGG